MWKKFQKKEKNKKSVKLGFISLGVLILLLIFGKSYSSMTSLYKPFSNEIGTQKNSYWDGNSSVNLVFASQKSNDLTDISVVNFQPKTKKVQVLHLSKDIYSDLPKGYGSWRIDSIYKLGQEEKEKTGAQLLKLSISRILGLPIDGIIIYSDSEQKLENSIIGWRKNPFSVLSFVSSAKTDLLPAELFSFIWSVSKVRNDLVLPLDLAQSNITESKLLPDSSRVLGLNAVRLDTFIRDNMSDTDMADENTSVAIFNATNHQGLAQLASRMVANLGASVVIVSNTEQIQEHSMVIIDNSPGQTSTPFSEKKLKQIFAPDCIKNPCRSNDPKVLSSRAKINIILGEDYYKYWYLRN